MPSFIADAPISSKRLQELADERLRLIGADPAQVAVEKLGFVLFEDGMDSFYGQHGSEQVAQLAKICAKLQKPGHALRLEGFATTTEKGFDQDMARAAKLAEARAQYVMSLIAHGLGVRRVIKIKEVGPANLTIPGFTEVPAMARRVDIYPEPKA